MSKKVEENLKSEEFWTLPKYKNKFGTDEYHEHLKKFLAKNDFEKLFRALKYSDILLKKSEKIKNTRVEAYEYSFDENGTKLYAISYFIILKENLLIANFYSISEKETEKMLEYFHSIKK